MNAKVRFGFIFPTERFASLISFERFLVRMDANVFCEKVTPSKSFTTPNTFEWFLCRITANVSGKITFPLECIAAMFAFESPQTVLSAECTYILFIF